jgi:hypothetical protein
MSKGERSHNFSPHSIPAPTFARGLDRIAPKPIPPEFLACVETVLTAQPGEAKKLQPPQTALFPKLDSCHPSRANPTKFSSIKE